MKYIVVDLEATCCDSGSFPREEMETIEIGAVKLDGNFNIISEFEQFILPKLNPTLTEFCKSLTTITQKDVDDAVSFLEGMENFYDWIGNEKDVVWLSWGKYDENQLLKDHKLHGMQYHMPEHKNLKNMFSAADGVNKKFGMKKALQRKGFTLDGTHHRGIDDARNASKLVEYCVTSEGA